jgi:hypothetical protein
MLRRCVRSTAATEAAAVVRRAKTCVGALPTRGFLVGTLLISQELAGWYRRQF